MRSETSEQDTASSTATCACAQRSWLPEDEPVTGPARLRQYQSLGELSSEEAARVLQPDLEGLRAAAAAAEAAGRGEERWRSPVYHERRHSSPQLVREPLVETAPGPKRKARRGRSKSVEPEGEPERALLQQKAQDGMRGTPPALSPKGEGSGRRKQTGCRGLPEGYSSSRKHRLEADATPDPHGLSSGMVSPVAKTFQYCSPLPTRSDLDLLEALSSECDSPRNMQFLRQSLGRQAQRRNDLRESCEHRHVETLIHEGVTIATSYARSRLFEELQQRVQKAESERDELAALLERQQGLFAKLRAELDTRQVKSGGQEEKERRRQHTAAAEMDGLGEAKLRLEETLRLRNELESVRQECADLRRRDQLRAESEGQRLDELQRRFDTREAEHREVQHTLEQERVSAGVLKAQLEIIEQERDNALGECKLASSLAEQLETARKRAGAADAVRQEFEKTLELERSCSRQLRIQLETVSGERDACVKRERLPSGIDKRLEAMQDRLATSAVERNELSLSLEQERTESQRLRSQFEASGARPSEPPEELKLSPRSAKPVDSSRSKTSELVLKPPKERLQCLELERAELLLNAERQRSVTRRLELELQTLACQHEEACGGTRESRLRLEGESDQRLAAVHEQLAATAAQRKELLMALEEERAAAKRLQAKLSQEVDASKKVQSLRRQELTLQVDALQSQLHAAVAEKQALAETLAQQKRRLAEADKELKRQRDGTAHLEARLQIAEVEREGFLILARQRETQIEADVQRLRCEAEAAETAKAELKESQSRGRKAESEFQIAWLQLEEEKQTTSNLESQLQELQSERDDLQLRVHSLEVEQRSTDCSERRLAAAASERLELLRGLEQEREGSRLLRTQLDLLRSEHERLAAKEESRSELGRQVQDLRQRFQ
ncbi:unnamed protein product, partial [Polarella glacialis]